MTRRLALPPLEPFGPLNITGLKTGYAQAADVYEQAFPDKAVVSIDCSDIIGFAGAIHCIVMHYAAPVGTVFGDRFEAP